MGTQYISERLPCNECGELILPSTAEKTGGLCMPCKSGYRKDIQFAKLRWGEEKKFLATLVGQSWNRLSTQVHKCPETFFTLSAANQTLFAVGALKANVCNGGFHQYFARSAADYFLVAIRGLMEMGATQSLRCVIRSREIYFGMTPIPSTLDARLTLLVTSVISDEQSQEVQIFERCFRSEEGVLNGRMEKFVEQRDLLNDNASIA